LLAELTRVTGDPTPFLRSSVEAVAAAYRWHYVLPFDRIGTDVSTGPHPSSRRDAWAARLAGKP